MEESCDSRFSRWLSIPNELHDRADRDVGRAKRQRHVKQSPPHRGEFSLGAEERLTRNRNRF